MESSSGEYSLHSGAALSHLVASLQCLCGLIVCSYQDWPNGGFRKIFGDYRVSDKQAKSGYDSDPTSVSVTEFLDKLHEPNSEVAQDGVFYEDGTNMFARAFEDIKVTLTGVRVYAHLGEISAFSNVLPIGSGAA